MRRGAASVVLMMALAGAACAADDSRVIVVQDADGYRLERNGEPYFVNGVGGMKYLDRLVEYGGNSVRTWGVGDIRPRTLEDGTLYSPLDEAHKRGLSVCVGIWVQHPRHGFDYDDRDAVLSERERIVGIVREFKDHPAILMWGVGNEATLATDNKVQVLQEINELARLIKLEDPDHPTMHAVPGPWDGLAALFAEHCPDVDILGINAYGGLRVVPQMLRDQGYTGPYMVTEFGTVGYWEVEEAPWGAPVEPTSKEKARLTIENYNIAVRDEPGRCLGSYAFLWGNKQERTETWFGMFLPTGEKVEAVDEMSRAWTGQWPDNRSPSLDGIDCDALMNRVPANTAYPATVRVSDPDGDELTYRWVVRAESTETRIGGDKEAPLPDVNGCIVGEGPSVTLRTPTEPGAYRLFVYVYDGNGAAGTANMPFMVE